MIVNLADQELVKWAVDHMLPWYYSREQGLSEPCLKIHLGHTTAYFCGGKLARLWAHADHEFFDDMFGELMQVFELCGRIPSCLADTDSFLEEINHRQGGNEAGPGWVR